MFSKRIKVLLAIFPLVDTNNTLVIAAGVGIFALGFISKLAISTLWKWYSPNSTSTTSNLTESTATMSNLTESTSTTSNLTEEQSDEPLSNVSDNLLREQKIVDALEANLLANFNSSETSDVVDNSQELTTTDVDFLESAEDVYFAYANKGNADFFHPIAYDNDWFYLSINFDHLENLELPLFCSALFALLSLMPYLRLNMLQWHYILERLENMPTTLFESLNNETQLLVIASKTRLNAFLFPPASEEGFIFSDSAT